MEAKQRKHADVIIQWANGATVEVKKSNGDWIEAAYPAFLENYEYRVKQSKAHAGMLVTVRGGAEEKYALVQVSSEGLKLFDVNDNDEIAGFNRAFDFVIKQGSKLPNTFDGYLVEEF